MTRTVRLTLIVALVALAFACTVPDNGPGDEVMGNFSFEAEPMAVPFPNDEPFDRCDFAESPDGGFSFSARFSRDSDGGAAYVTVGGHDHVASFDGQILAASYSAPRTFAECGCSSVELQETLTVAVLSTSQNEALGNRCPDSPLDGGAPMPTGDGGIVAPGTTPTGFDAARACGELWDVVSPAADSGCSCAPCWMRYSVSGVRR